MLLRDHPLMSRYGVPNWPPVWTWIGGAEDKLPKGEVGILMWAVLTGIKPPDKCYLVIDHDGSTYNHIAKPTCLCNVSLIRE